MFVQNTMELGQRRDQAKCNAFRRIFVAFYTHKTSAFLPDQPQRLSWFAFRQDQLVQGAHSSWRHNQFFRIDRLAISIAIESLPKLNMHFSLSFL